MIAAAIMMEEPKAMVKRRPIQSLTYAAGMKAGKPPKLIPAMIRPRILVLTSPMLSCPKGCQPMFGEKHKNLHCLMVKSPFIRLPSNLSMTQYIFQHDSGKEEHTRWQQPMRT
jgi:hypothetical protein